MLETKLSRKKKEKKKEIFKPLTYSTYSFEELLHILMSVSIGAFDKTHMNNKSGPESRLQSA